MRIIIRTASSRDHISAHHEAKRRSAAPQAALPGSRTGPSPLGVMLKGLARGHHQYQSLRPISRPQLLVPIFLVKFYRRLPDTDFSISAKMKASSIIQHVDQGILVSVCLYNNLVGSARQGQIRF